MRYCNSQGLCVLNSYRKRYMYYVCILIKNIYSLTCLLNSSTLTGTSDGGLGTARARGRGNVATICP